MAGFLQRAEKAGADGDGLLLPRREKVRRPRQPQRYQGDAQPDLPLRRGADGLIELFGRSPVLSGEAEGEAGPLGAEEFPTRGQQSPEPVCQLAQRVAAAGVAIEHIDPAEVLDAQLHQHGLLPPLPEGADPLAQGFVPGKARDGVQAVGDAVVHQDAGQQVRFPVLAPEHMAPAGADHILPRPVPGPVLLGPAGKLAGKDLPQVLLVALPVVGVQPVQPDGREIIEELPRQTELLHPEGGDPGHVGLHVIEEGAAAVPRRLGNSVEEPVREAGDVALAALVVEGQLGLLLGLVLVHAVVRHLQHLPDAAVAAAGEGIAHGHAGGILLLLGEALAGVVDRLDLALDHRLRLVVVEGHELVAAHAVDALRALHLPGEDAGDGADVPVPLQMAVEVIDRLEVVDIAEDHGVALAAALPVALLHLADIRLVAVTALDAGEGVHLDLLAEEVRRILQGEEEAHRHDGEGAAGEKELRHRPLQPLRGHHGQEQRQQRQLHLPGDAPPAQEEDHRAGGEVQHRHGEAHHDERPHAVVDAVALQVVERQEGQRCGVEEHRRQPPAPGPAHRRPGGKAQPHGAAEELIGKEHREEIEEGVEEPVRPVPHPPRRVHGQHHQDLAGHVSHGAEGQTQEAPAVPARLIGQGVHQEEEQDHEADDLLPQDQQRIHALPPFPGLQNWNRFHRFSVKSVPPAA